MVDRGAIPGGTQRNQESVAAYVSWGTDVGPVARVLLCDAQTSGGLLIALPERDAPALVAALEKEGTPAAAIIGRVVAGPAGALTVA
jgi:selenide,water dikinase